MLERRVEAVAVYNDVVERFGRCNEPDLLIAVAGALAYKGNALNRLGRSEEAIAAYDGLIARFAQAWELAVIEYVPLARTNREAAG